MKASATSIEDEIYEAAFIPEQWPSVLSVLAATANAKGGVAFSTGDHGTAWTASEQIHELARIFIEQGWPNRNSRVAAGLRQGILGSRGFKTEFDLFGAEGPGDDPLYSEFFRPNGLGVSAGATILLPHGDLVIFSVENDEREGPISASSVETLDHFYSHLARAAMIAGRLHFEQVQSAVRLLAQIGLPSLAIDAEARVVVDDSSLGGRHDLWRVGARDRLLLSDPQAQVQLTAALSESRTRAVIRSIPVRGRDLSTQAVLQVLPIRRQAHDLFGRAVAVLVLTTQRADLRDMAPLVQTLFDLTPAEVSVVLALGQGGTPKSIARATLKSVDTIRNQIKSVLRKTGCNRSADLVRLISDIAPRPPIRTSGTDKTR